MTTYYGPLGLRNCFSSLITFFLTIFAISLFLNKAHLRQEETPTPLFLNKAHLRQEETPTPPPSSPPVLLNESKVERREEMTTPVLPPPPVALNLSKFERQEERITIPYPPPPIASNASKGDDTCDLFSGRWVYDNSTHPLYSWQNCSFMHDEIACEKFGRKDRLYQNWRWQPHGCDIPRHGSFEDQDKNFEEIELALGLEVALRTWSEWLESHVDTNKTQLFFVSLSPTHVCETEPITKEGYMSRGTDYSLMRMVEAAVEGLRYKGVHVQILNITQLSEYRKDGHPSIYRRQYVPLTEEQLANPTSYSDCTHWCLPGVPDTWNELLYTYIMSR
ncbi:putative protein trichome birefringence-like 34 [Cocos nucifera]|uniref:Trichome birefringence-like C-terminal domain-containing protein n=1 Tax=Cocos nucifera TaxID=13894 RepID=A0A8K0I532_COCNU|nr:putative protein trichome birefringence-like 34 [Cocos nucifera]